MNRRRRTLLLGLTSLVLLALGVGAAVVWPLSVMSDAERAAARVRVGMPSAEPEKTIGPTVAWVLWTDAGFHRHGIFPDGSLVSIHIDLTDRVGVVTATPSTSAVPPPTRLRRTLARMLPFLK